MNVLGVSVSVDGNHSHLEQPRCAAVHHIFSWPSTLLLPCVCTACRSPYGYAPDSNQAPPDEPPPNHILLYTVFNPMYTINVVSGCMLEGQCVGLLSAPNAPFSILRCRQCSWNCG